MFFLRQFATSRGTLKFHKMDNYNGATHDFGRVIDRAEIPSPADYTRRACAYCCAQVRLLVFA